MVQSLFLFWFYGCYVTWKSAGIFECCRWSDFPLKRSIYYDKEIPVKSLTRPCCTYSRVSNKHVGWNKRAGRKIPQNFGNFGDLKVFETYVHRSCKNVAQDCSCDLTSFFGNFLLKLLRTGQVANDYKIMKNDVLTKASAGLYLDLWAFGIDVFQ